MPDENSSAASARSSAASLRSTLTTVGLRVARIQVLRRPAFVVRDDLLRRSRTRTSTSRRSASSTATRRVPRSVLAGVNQIVSHGLSCDRSPATARRVAARADDRLDELVVGVLVAAAHQLGERLPAVGSIVEAAGEIERADRVVRGPDREDARPRRRSARSDVADGRRLGRLQVLADAAAAVEPRRRQRVRARAIRARPTRARSARRSSAISSSSRRSRLAGPIAQPMGFAAPVARRGANVIGVRLGRQRNGQRSRRPRRPDDRGPRRPDRAPRPAAPRRPRWSAAGSDRGGALRRPARTPDRGARRVVHGDQQLAESRLTEVVDEQLGVAAAEIDAGRLLELRRAAHAGPTSPPSSARSPGAADSGARTMRHQNASAPPAPVAPAPAEPPPTPRLPQPSTSSTRRGSHVGSAVGRERRLRRTRGTRTSARRRRRRRPSSGRNRSERRPGPRAIDGERHRDERDRHRQRHDGDAQRRPPAIEPPHRRRAPEPLLVPEPLRAVDRREQRADDADAAAGDDVELDAGFVQRAQDAGVIGAGGAGAGQDERGAALWRVGFGGRTRRRARSFRRLRRGSSSSLTISNSRVPPGVTTFTESPGSLFRNARPIGDVVEISPLAASASSGMTSWNTSFSPVLLDDVQRRAEAGAVGGNPIDVDQRDLRRRASAAC